MPITPDTAASLLSIVASVGSMLQSYFSLRRSGVEGVPSPQVIQQAFDKKNAKLQAQNGLLTVAIDKKTCDVLIERAKEIQKKIIEIFEDKITPIATKDIMLGGFTRDYCWILMHLKRRLKEDFPKDFEEERRQNDCENYTF